MGGLALILGLGCYVNSIETGKPAGEDYEETVPYYLWGLMGEASFDVDKICPSGVSEIHEEMAVEDALLTAVTCGIYTPRSYTITCVGGTSFVIQPDVNTGLAMVTPQEVR